VNVQFPVPATSPPGKIIKYPIGKELSKFLSQSGALWRKETILPSWC